MESLPYILMGSFCVFTIVIGLILIFLSKNKPRQLLIGLCIGLFPSIFFVYLTIREEEIHDDAIPIAGEPFPKSSEISGEYRLDYKSQGLLKVDENKDTIILVLYNKMDSCYLNETSLFKEFGDCSWQTNHDEHSISIKIGQSKITGKFVWDVDDIKILIKDPPDYYRNIGFEKKY